MFYLSRELFHQRGTGFFVLFGGIVPSNELAARKQAVALCSYTGCQFKMQYLHLSGALQVCSDFYLKGAKLCK